MAELSAEDLAWAAGLFEGEGCFMVRRRPETGTMQVGAFLGMKDRDVVERFMRIVGCGRLYESTHNRAPYFEWRVTKAATAVAVAQLLLPYLGQRRTAKAEELIRVGSAIGVRTHCKRGHRQTDENVYIDTRGNRQCRPCSLARQAQYRAARRSSKTRKRAAKSGSAPRPDAQAK